MLAQLTGSTRQMADDRGKLVLVGNRCIKNRELKAAAKKLESHYELCFSDTGIEYAGNVAEEDDIVMVYDDFTDEIFEKLNSRNCNIIGPQIVFSSVTTDPPILVRRRRPAYNNALKDQVICFTGFNNREEISTLASLVHYMSGAIRKDFNPNVTHLVANSSKGEKYQKAASLGRPIMLQNWIHHLWEKRDNPEITGNSASMMHYKAPPFFGCGIAFHGFSKEDVSEMEAIAMDNGGTLCTMADIDCTHVVVDDVQTIPTDIRPCLAVVKAEWFWTSMQREVCAAAFLFTVSREGDENSPSKHTPTRSRYSISRSKKRKRQIRGNLAFIANESELTPGSASYKSRRSSVEQLTASILSSDITPDSSGCLLDSPLSGDPLKKTPKSMSPEKKVTTGKASAKQLVVTELLQTELNYCGILSNILKIFRDGAENVDQPGGAILSNTDSKIIFGKIPPILEVHVEIMTDLEKLLENWSDELPVADVILSRVDKLRQAYPPFVNYFEKTKEKVKECISVNPRFHAFMKVCERRTECGRQKLHELMMNIVQRLPRIELLLQQIHKYSDKKSSDHHRLEEAQASLKDVTKHINEDKRIADERMALFEIVHDIDNCPANLLSASRNFVHKFDVDEVSDELVGRGEHLTLFLFTDSLEIVKRRNKTSTTPFKSPATSKASSSHAHKSKPFKHVEFMTLTSIKRIIDIDISKEGEEVDSSPVFSLLCRTVTDTREKLYTFQVQDSDNSRKDEFMRTLALNIANCCCRTDIDTFITSRPAAEFMITPLELCSSNKSVTRAVSKFSKRLSRVMTMKGVASPLKRAVSTMMTPNRRSTLRRHDMSISSTASMWELDRGDDSPQLSAQQSDSSPQLHASGASTLPRNAAERTFRVSSALTKPN